MNGLGTRLGAAWLAINNIISFGGSYTIEPNGCSRRMYNIIGINQAGFHFGEKRG